jgi:pantoate--beta-alanine ligase
MKIIESVSEMREYSQKLKNDGLTIGSVDTDCFLHEAHMSLVKVARENCDVVVLALSHSLSESTLPEIKFDKYLREYKDNMFSSDIALCEHNNVSVVFHAPKGSWDHRRTPFLTVPNIDRVIKKKLACMPIIAEMLQAIEVVSPDVVLLGQKDFFQTTILKILLKDSHPHLKVITAPTIRDPGGLALSSRNRFLTKVQRERACSVYKSLQEVAELTSYPSVKALKRKIFNNIKNAHGSVFSIDIVCAETMGDLDIIDRPAVVFISATFGKVYLWDNILISPK